MNRSPCRARRALTCLLPALVLFYAGRVAAQDAVFMASTVPAYRPGAAVSLGERIIVPEGGSLALLFRSGQAVRMQGPVELVLELPATPRREGLAAALAEALRLRGVDASVIGATRAGLAPVPVRPRDIAVDVTRGGTWCIGAADRIWLSGPGLQETRELVLRSGRLQRYLAWPAGAERIAWPEELAVEDGDRFDLLQGDRTIAALRFRIVTPRWDEDPAEVAEGLLLGCHAQYDAALQRVARRLLDR